MPSEINARLEFQERIKSLPVEERTTETALMIYDLSRKFDECINPIKGRRDGAISGSITGTITAVIIGVISYFSNKG